MEAGAREAAFGGTRNISFPIRNGGDGNEYCGGRFVIGRPRQARLGKNLLDRRGFLTPNFPIPAILKAGAFARSGSGDPARGNAWQCDRVAPVERLKVREIAAAARRPENCARSALADPAGLPEAGVSGQAALARRVRAADALLPR